MNLPEWLVRRVHATLLNRVVAQRDPDFIIGGEDNPYLLRWWVIPRNRFFNVYLHQFCRSDDDRALHDHPWWSISVLLRGSYVEHMPGRIAVRREGQVVARGASALHRVALFGAPDGWDDGRERPVWTLFITGWRMREWGFACPQGWRHWRDFCGTAPDGKNNGRVGRGCD